MRNIDKIRDKLIKTKITNRYEALYNYGISFKELENICLDLRKEGFYIKKIPQILNVEYILTTIDKKC